MKTDIDKIVEELGMEMEMQVENKMLQILKQLTPQNITKEKVLSLLGKSFDSMGLQMLNKVWKYPREVRMEILGRLWDKSRMSK